jgi:hypothetical protein
MAGGPHEVAEYVSELCREMQQMASHVGLNVLAQLLGATALEAQRHRKPPLRVIDGGLEDRGKD